MSGPLSYLSTLEEVISTSDEELNQGLGYLSPDTVKDYVMYLRNQLRIAQKGREAADAEVSRMRRQVSEKEVTLAGMMSALGVGNTPATAPPHYNMSAPPPAPGTLSAVPNLTYTGYGQELADISSSAQPATFRLTPDCPQINTIHNNANLEPGYVVRATFVYQSKTEKFNINLLRTNTKFYIFHLDFRPYPNGNVIVMNTNPDKNWGQEIRAELPPLTDGRLYHVTIHCEKNQFRVKINDREIEKTFPYRYPLREVAVIKVNHGTLGNKWIALSWERDLASGRASSYIPDKDKGCSQGSSGSTNSSVDDPAGKMLPIKDVIGLGGANLRPGMKITARAFFKKGTKKFTINLMKQAGFYVFHLDFRPYPHGQVIVMNTNPNTGWQKEIRSELPHLTDGQIMNVVVEFTDKEFKVSVNDKHIENTFPYRYPLQDVNQIKVSHGSNGNKWISLEYN